MNEIVNLVAQKFNSHRNRPADWILSPSQVRRYLRTYRNTRTV